MIGERGMGTVYKAHDSKMRRDVAIKVLPPELAKEPGGAHYVDGLVSGCLPVAWKITLRPISTAWSANRS